VKRALDRANIEAILQEARRVRRRWPLAVCVATGGAVAPSDSAGADLGDIASAIVDASLPVQRNLGVDWEGEKGTETPVASPILGGMGPMMLQANYQQSNQKLLDRNGNDATKRAA